ncbi:ThiF-like protein [Pontimonas salivibrio]|uniref:ThiF-like protein n=1 Tax=Pontimonas salivibrio TaxID=1159327 RepID=A0A2L2BS43_9MICO|nr:hypothetical protein [Pontimonas salivibrio]AVG24479.1 ThiF-like protein [Pontimonas salivibrio]
MSQRVYRLHTKRPLLWRTPNDLQVGLDVPHTVVNGIDDRAAPILHALYSGVSEGGLRLLRSQTGVSEEAVNDLLTQLAPACEPDPEPLQRSVYLVGTSSQMPVMAGVLGAMGVQVVSCDDVHDLPDAVPGGVILVSDYVAHPDWVSVLSQTDIPHTPVIFSDLTVQVGPRIQPGHSPCLSCVDHVRRVDNPHWLTVQSQLWGIPALQSTPASAGVSATLVCLLHGLLGPLPHSLGVSAPGVALDWRPQSGALSIRTVDFHPSCTCRGL